MFTFGHFDTVHKIKCQIIGSEKLSNVQDAVLLNNG